MARRRRGRRSPPTPDRGATGFLLVSRANAFRAPELFAATALVSLLSVGVALGLERLNRRLGHWR